MPQSVHHEATTSPPTEQTPTPPIEQTSTQPTEQVSDAAFTSIATGFAPQLPESPPFEAPSTPANNSNYVSEAFRQTTPAKPPSVRITKRCHLFPHTDNAVSAEVDRRLPEGKAYLTLGASSFHLAAVGRTIVTPGPSRRTAVRLLNLSNRPVDIHAGTVVAVLVSAELATRSAEKNQSDEGTMPKVNFDTIPEIARGLLAYRLTQYRHLFAKDDGQAHSEDLEPPDTDTERMNFFERDSANNLPAYLAECRPARNTFPFPTEACAVRCSNDTSWQLALSYAGHHIPQRFHATLQLPTEIQLPSAAPNACFVTTLTPLHYSASNELLFHTLRRLVALCTSAIDQLSLPPGYAQLVADLETHISSVMAIYSPVILFATQDAADTSLDRYLDLINNAGLRLDADRSFIAEPKATVCGVTFESQRCYAANRSQNLRAAPYAPIFKRIRTLWTPLPNHKCFVHVTTDSSDEAFAVIYQEQPYQQPVAILAATISTGRAQPWHHTATLAMRLLASSFPANAAITLCCPERHGQLQVHLNRILKNELKSTIAPCTHRLL